MANEYMIPSMTDSGNAIFTTSLADYRKQLVDNVYNDVPVLRILQQSGRKRMIDGGASIVEHLITDKQSEGGFYSGATGLNTSQGDDTMLCEYKWQNCYEPIQITRDEERQNSGSSHKLLDLVGMKIQLSEMAIKDRLGQALVTSVADAGNLVDLSTLVNTGTLGTVAGGTYSFWQATSTTSGAFATQGLSDMQTLYYVLSSSSNLDNPTHIITTRTVFTKYEQTRLPLERLQNTSTGSAGFTNLTFKGTPIIYDQYVDSGVMYMLNTNYWNLCVDSETDFVTTPFISPTNQTVKCAFILWRGNQTTNNRRRFGKLTSIS
jgi:hypothetical protein